MLATVLTDLKDTSAQLVAVSKTRSNDQIMTLYEQGVRKFGENRVPELVEKQQSLPADINWHFIGHLQSKKVKHIAAFVELIHAVDSSRLLEEINKQAKRNERVIDVLLQFKIAEEESKYGFAWSEATDYLDKIELSNLANIRIVGVMGMATFTNDQDQVRKEFKTLEKYFDRLKTDYFSTQPYFKEISMGMSGDYKLAIEEGSTMVRIGSLLF